MDADTINKVRVKVGEAVREKGGLELIWDVAPKPNQDEMFCTAVIRDNGRELIATCGNFYDFQENGMVDITAYMKRGEGDYYLREAVDQIRFELEQTDFENVSFDDIIQDVPLESDQTQYAIFLQVAFRAYTSRPINN